MYLINIIISFLFTEKYNQVELMLKTNENKSVNVSNTNTINNISLKKCDSNVIHKSQIEFIEQNVTEGNLFNYSFYFTLYSKFEIL